MNAERFKLVLDTIKYYPDTWDQKAWHFHTEGCATTHCFAGWAQILSGEDESSWLAQEHARTWLELTVPECEYLFDIDRTIEDFELFYQHNAPLEIEEEDLVACG